MRTRVGTACVLLAAAWLGLAAAARADAPSLVWERDNDVIGPEGISSPMTSRLLADGTVAALFVAASSPRTLASVRFSESSVTSAVLIDSPSFFYKAELDAFGDVVVSDYLGPDCTIPAPCPPPGYGDVWAMKFHGVTGKPMWKQPAIWDGPGHLGDTPFSVSVDPHGDILVAVMEDDYHNIRLLKLDGATGEQLWTSAAFVDAWSVLVAADDADVLLAVGRNAGDIDVRKLDGGTGAIVWGPVEIDPGPAAQDGPVSWGISAEGDAFLLSWSGPFGVLTRFQGSNGSIQWGPRTIFVPLVQTALKDLIVSRDGRHLAAAGFSQIASFDAETGEMIWHRITPPYLDSSLREASNGDLVLTAQFGSQSGLLAGSMRFGRDGAVLWGPELSPSVLWAVRILSLIDRDGRVVEIAMRESDGHPHFLRRNGGDGQPSGPPIEFAGLTRRAWSGVVAEIDPGGDLIILTAGVTSPFAVVKLDHATGSPLWSYEVPDTVGGVQLAVDSSGDVAVHHWATAGTVLRKLDGGSGVPIWGPVPTGPPGSPGDLAFAPDGSILLVSSIIPPQLVQRRSGADGSLIWEAEVGSGDHLAVDGSGDVFLLGQQGASSLLSKYAGSSGALLWGPVVQDDPLWGELMVTPQGDPIVGGQGVGGASAVKYDGATGALLWGPIGPGAGTYYYQGLVVDPSGDVFLTGTAADPTFADIVAARLSGVDGSFVWGPLTYDGGENEQALAAGLDPLGNLVVGGVTAPTYLSLGHRSLILGYDAETGSMLWDPLFGETPYASVQFVRSGDGLLYTIDRISRPEGTAVRAFTFALGVETPPDDFLVDCGDFLSLQLEAGNEVGVVVWSLEAGTLPAGVTLTSGGLLSGTPMEVGDFPIRVRVEDSTMAFATRDLTIVVGFGDPIPIVATPLSSCQVLLQVPGSWDNYRWEPGGEATPFIVVSPFHDTVYGVTVSDVSGCPMRETVLVRATRLVDPSCDAPSIFLMSPTSGPASGGTLVGLNGTQFQIGATVRIGGLDADASISSPGSGSATTPALQPGALHTVLLTNPDAASAFSPIRFFADFLDVGQGHLFHDFVESIVRAGVTAGCGEGNYCPDAVVRRDQIAVFLLRSRYGPTYEPPPATGTVFGDVNIGTFAGNYIEALAAAGVTAGCGGGNYCPADPVTREQVAVFLLRTLEGPTYVPPPCTSPTFSDVPCSSGFAAWIEELVTRGITAGCGGGLYCPLLEVTRGQMAVFLTETFGL